MKRDEWKIEVAEKFMDFMRQEFNVTFVDVTPDIPDDDGDEYYDDDDLDCEWCGAINLCLCDKAMDCICGAYGFHKDGTSGQFSDCICGA